MRRVCLVSGGTGGHLMPALVLARALRARGHEPVLVTEGRDVERSMVERELPDVAAVPLPGGRAGERPSRLALPWWVARTTLAARKALRDEHIDCVVSTGGRTSVPVGLAAKSLGVPLFLLEQNAVTGRANRWLSPFARRIYHGLPSRDERRNRALLTGTPLRPDVGRVNRDTARAALGLESNAPLLLVVGGSQGAQKLNELVPKALRQLQLPVAVVHLTGIGKDFEVAQRYAAQRCSESGGADRIDAEVLSASTDMARLYAAADLVVCRGGGTTVAELIAAGRAAVVVPYPHHKDRQQVHNAEVLVLAGAAVLVEEHELTAVWLADILTTLLGDTQRLHAMGDAARRVSPGDATAAIINDLERVNGWHEVGR